MVWPYDLHTHKTCKILRFDRTLTFWSTAIWMAWPYDLHVFPYLSVFWGFFLFPFFCFSFLVIIIRVALLLSSFIVSRSLLQLLWLWRNIRGKNEWMEENEERSKKEEEKKNNNNNQNKNKQRQQNNKWDPKFKQTKHVLLLFFLWSLLSKQQKQNNKTTNNNKTATMGPRIQTNTGKRWQQHQTQRFLLH